jgi:hypothetical protein
MLSYWGLKTAGIYLSLGFKMVNGFLEILCGSNKHTFYDTRTWRICETLSWKLTSNVIGICVCGIYILNCPVRSLNYISCQLSTYILKHLSTTCVINSSRTSVIYFIKKQGIYLDTFLMRSRGSSVSIVSDYGLDCRAIGVRSPAGSEDFSSSLYVQTGSEAHPASCPMGTGAPFPRGKARPGRDADHSPHLVPRSRMSRSCTSSPPKGLHGLSGLLYFLNEFSVYLILI